ncbi:putative uncharacterized protein DDB_G0282133 [Argonauta hians]
MDSSPVSSAKTAKTASSSAKIKSKTEKRVRMSSRRSANFTHHEKEILLSLMQTYRHVVEDKRTDGIMVKEKNAAWIELTNKYNAQNEVWTRSVKQLRQCWKNLKSRARIDLMRVNLPTNPSESDSNTVRLSLVPINNVIKLNDNPSPVTLNSTANINNNTNMSGNLINNNNINNANDNNPPNIILSSILNNNNNNNINNNNNSNSLKPGLVASYGNRLQTLLPATSSNNVVGLSPSLHGSDSISNKLNSKLSASKKRKKKVASNDVATNDNSNSNNSNNSSRRQQHRLLTIAPAGVPTAAERELDDLDDEEDEDVDDDEDDGDAVAVLASDNDDGDGNTIGSRRRRRRRLLHPAIKSTSIVGDNNLLDEVADENDELDDDENDDEEEEDEDEDEDIEDENAEVDEDDDDIDDSGTVDEEIYNDVDEIRVSSGRQHGTSVNVDSFHVDQNSNPSIVGQSATSQDVDPVYSVESLAVVSVSGSADRIHFQQHGSSPTHDLQNQTDGNLLHSHHPHHPHHHQHHHHHHHHQQQPHHPPPPPLHSQVSSYHSNRLTADSITRLDEDYSTSEPDIKVFDSIRGFGKVLHTQPSFHSNNHNSVNFTPSINYTSNLSDQSGPLIVSAHTENDAQISGIAPVLMEKSNDNDVLLDDLRKTEHAEKMKNIRLERRLINVEHKARMGLIKLKSEYIRLKMDCLRQNKT